MTKAVKVLENHSKHYTKAERAARSAAEKSLTRETRVRIPCPKDLAPEARLVFEETKKKLRPLGILDPADSNALATYSDLVAKYWKMSRRVDDDEMSDLDFMKVSQAWLPKIRSYEDSLGLTPLSRAHLAKKKADTEPVDPFEEMLNNINSIRQDPDRMIDDQE
jgi:phage terminase small subunit